jgi:guanylate kinase
LIRLGDYVRILKVNNSKEEKYIDSIGKVTNAIDSYYMKQLRILMQDGVSLSLHPSNVEKIQEKIDDSNDKEETPEEFMKRILKERKDRGEKD